MLKYFSTQSKYDCFGCNACEKICGRSAIRMVADEEGFNYPILDASKCTDCGLCDRVCPVMHPDSTLNAHGQSYAAQNQNADILKKSSSGGIFYVIAKHVLDNDGVVYGVGLNNECVAKNRRIESIEEIYPLMGSKYVQSDTNSTFPQVRNDLREGRLVYYTGTPCQIAGLRLFLMRDYPNLITSDLICHGTPSQKLFSTMIEHIEKRYGGKVVNYNFRDKNIRGWSCTSSSSLKRGNQVKYIKYSKEMEAYFNAFSKGVLMRWGCYRCPFAQLYRTSDITLGDFWGAREIFSGRQNINRGVSVILINTEKGKKLVEELQSFSLLEKIPIEWAQKNNDNLVRPTPDNPLRETIYTMAYSDFDAFVTQFGGEKEKSKRVKREIEFFVRSHPLIFCAVSNILHCIKG